MTRMSKIARPILPNFLIAGAAKCGTTSLYHYLKQHPDVFMSPVKEPKFFSGCRANRGTGPGDAMVEQSVVKSFSEYASLFKKSCGKQAVGEASVDTFFYPEVSIPAIQRHLGDPRIIIILRDPVERAYSAYRYITRDGFETLSFREAVSAEKKRRQDGYRFMWQYQDGSLYVARVRLFQKNFRRVLVLLYDDLAKDAPSLFLSLCNFLEINSEYVPDMKVRHNVSGIPRWPLLHALFVKPKQLHKIARTIGGAIMGADRWVRLRDRARLAILKQSPPLDPEIEQQLRLFYRDDILTLQDAIGRDLSSWLGRNQLLESPIKTDGRHTIRQE